MDNTGIGNYNLGDILFFENDSQTYVVTTEDGIEWTAPGTEPVGISPSKKVALVGGEAVTVLGDHKVGLSYPPEAAVFMTRMLPVDEDTVGIFDEINSGLSLNYTRIKGYHMNNAELSILWNAKVLDPSRIVRVISPPV